MTEKQFINDFCEGCDGCAMWADTADECPVAGDAWNAYVLSTYGDKLPLDWDT